MDRNAIWRTAISDKMLRTEIIKIASCLALIPLVTTEQHYHRYSRQTVHGVYLTVLVDHDHRIVPVTKDSLDPEKQELPTSYISLHMNDEKTFLDRKYVWINDEGILEQSNGPNYLISHIPSSDIEIDNISDGIKIKETTISIEYVVRVTLREFLDSVQRLVG